MRIILNKLLEFFLQSLSKNFFKKPSLLCFWNSLLYYNILTNDRPLLEYQDGPIIRIFYSNKQVFYQKISYLCLISKQISV